MGGDSVNRDDVLSQSDMAAHLPAVLAAEGIALKEDSDLCEECVRFCVKRGCTTIREALREVREALSFVLESAARGAAANTKLQKLMTDSREVAELLLESSHAEVPRSADLPILFERLRDQGRSGARVHRPLRLLLTGRANGACVADILRLIELAEVEGGDECGPSLQQRLSIVKQMFIA